MSWRYSTTTSHAQNAARVASDASERAAGFPVARREVPDALLTSNPTRLDRTMSRNLHNEVTTRILAELRNGSLPWVKPWSAIMAAHGSTMPHNAATGRPYSGINVILLWGVTQAYSSPRFLTFKQAQELGGSVRKGERGHKVYFVSTFEKSSVKDNGDEELRRVPFLKEYTVFNVAQCDNLPARLITGDV